MFTLLPELKKPTGDFSVGIVAYIRLQA